MKRLLVITAATLSLSVLGLAAPALAAPNPSGIGRPSQTCQNFSTFPGLTGPQYPGHTSTSPGSVFNETTPGKGGFQYNFVGAPSQYDVACFQQISNH
jgi:hypothetical protein